MEMVYQRSQELKLRNSKPLVGVQIAFTLLVSCVGGLFVQVAGSAHFDPLIWPVFFNIVADGPFTMPHSKQWAGISGRDT
ncbi:hypothetical protein COOONC_17612 [Cooperia oncophora]